MGARWIEEAERALGSRVQCVRIGNSAVSETYAITLERGSRLFGKVALASAPPRLIEEEVTSLGSLASTRTVRVPEVLASGAGWLVLEWIEPGDDDAAGASAYGKHLGSTLAALHSVAGPEYGWPGDNYIGALPQRNRAHADWPSFWRDERILPLVISAFDAELLDATEINRIDRLLARLEDVIGTAEGPSLLHGDLWSGNAMRGADGLSVVVDPSCYYGHREVDLAMAALFGGFPSSFYATYEDALPLMPGWESRRAVYQLYYLLAHLIMFGSGYRDMTLRAITAAGY